MPPQAAFLSSPRTLAASFAFGCLAAVGIVSVAAFAGAGRDPVGTVVSQAGRTFTPDLVEIARGETVLVVNDDGGIVHHAYVDGTGMRYDSGDQEPGDRAPIAFAEPGTFQVMCGIHPRMSLTVRVR